MTVLSAQSLMRLGRCLLALLFLTGAVQKAVSPVEVQEILARAGLPTVLVWPALAYNAIAGIALIAGWRLYPIALSLALYCLITSAFHFQPDDSWQISIMIKNWAIAGGCLVLAAASQQSLDHYPPEEMLKT